MRLLLTVLAALALGCGQAEEEEGLALPKPERTDGCAAATAGATGARLPPEVAEILPGRPDAHGARELPGGGVQATTILEGPLPETFIDVVERAGLGGWEYTRQELERPEGVGELLLKRGDRTLDLKFSELPDCTTHIRVVVLYA